MNCDLHIPDDKLKSLLRECIDFKREFIATLQDPDVRRELTGVVMNKPVDEVAVKADTPEPVEVGQWVCATSHMHSKDDDTPGEGYDPDGYNYIGVNQGLKLGGNCEVICANGNEFYCPTQDLRPATDAEVAEALGLKKGDVIQSWRDVEQDIFVGDKFVVQGVSDDGEVIFVDRAGDMRYRCISDYHLVSRASSQPVEHGANRPFQWRDLVEIVGADVRGEELGIGATAFVGGVENDGQAWVAYCGEKSAKFPSSSLRLLRTSEEVVKWVGGAK